VTSPSGAAIQDVLHVLSRRFCPEVILDPVRVQGAGAAQEIAAAIGRLNRFSQLGHPLDVILVTRGGGSLEDLWCFNEEVVARAIAASEVPVVSAVGHEIDFTIADFVADFRAATPSAAAEILTQDWVDSREFVESAGHRLAVLAQRRLIRSRDSLEGSLRRWIRAHPRRRLETRSQQVDETIESLRRVAARSVRTWGRLLEAHRQRMLAQRPRMRVRAGQQELLRLRSALTVLPGRKLQRRRQLLESLLARLRLLSPQNVLNRGYSLTLDAETGGVVRDATSLVSGRRLQTRLQSGEVFSVVTRVSGGSISEPSTESSQP
jgi:exodeoxyribonuclease VII large subunit